MTLQIFSQSPQFTAGIVILNNRCVEAAPVVKYLIGWKIKAIQEYAVKRKWIIREV